MSLCVFSWLDPAIKHARHVFDHTSDRNAQQCAEWEVSVLEGWRAHQTPDVAHLIAHHIHPLINTLRHHFDHSRNQVECGLIEWKLARLAAWERHLSQPPPPAHPRLRP